MPTIVLKEFEDVLSLLTYRSYEWNRDKHPEISVERWGEIFSRVEDLEKIYQKHKEVKDGKYK